MPENHSLPADLRVYRAVGSSYSICAKYPLPKKTACCTNLVKNPELSTVFGAIKSGLTDISPATFQSVLVGYS